MSERQQQLQEAWFLKTNDPITQQAIWLRFTTLRSANGFKKIAEVWAIVFQRGANRDVTKRVFKQTFDSNAFSGAANGTLSLGTCELSRNHARGSIHLKGQSIEWDLAITPGHEASFELVPPVLSRSETLVGGYHAETWGEDLRFSGKVTLSGVGAAPEVVEFKNAAGMIGHHSGRKAGHSWVWGHCNLFVDASGRPAPFLFEGLAARARWMGTLPSPQYKAFYFHYEGKPYAFNTAWDSLRSISKHTLTDWEFQAERGDIGFRGKCKAEHRDFAGLTYEDTNGALLYCANSKLAQLEIHVFRKGKLENAFYGNGTAAFEIVTREKNPYVQLLA